jgi:hypothetical protein
MADLPRISQYQRFPEGVVYPGHPVCIALLIMDKYPDFETARMRPEGSQFQNALSDIDIPGAGGNVHAALDVLERARAQGAPAAFEHGTEYWVRCASGENFGKNQAAGLEQAEGIKDDFLSRVDAWVAVPEPA